MRSPHGTLPAALHEPYDGIVGRALRELPLGVGEVDKQIRAQAAPGDPVEHRHEARAAAARHLARQRDGLPRLEGPRPARIEPLVAPVNGHAGADLRFQRVELRRELAELLDRDRAAGVEGDVQLRLAAGETRQQARPRRAATGAGSCSRRAPRSSGSAR